MTALRWLAFGDLHAELWGMAWIPGEEGQGHAAVAAGEDIRVLAARLQDAGGNWELTGDGLELAVAAAGPDQPARATGSLTANGSERAIDASGWRAVTPELPEAGKLDSLRVLAAWFEGDEGLSVVAARPRKARGQEGDELSAALFESGRVQSVIEARLSTTYTRDGIPSRVGVELWVSVSTDDAEAPTERPHRVAGEAVGPRAAWSERGLELGAQPIRWHSHGRDGTGVYVLGRPG